MTLVPTFAVISGAQVSGALRGREVAVVDLVEKAYRLHGQGETVNPPSYFLRFPDRPSSRIIALPASVGGDVRVHGVKWISSFPDNVPAGVPRASAVLILNDPDCGYPFACIEASVISAARTAASATLATTALTGTGRPRPTHIGFVGAGLIARYVHAYLCRNGFRFDTVNIHDRSPTSAEGFARYVAHSGSGTVVNHATAADLMRSSELVVFATLASEPHVHDTDLLRHNPLILHLSLRDLSTEMILRSYNVVDDLEHCLQANTSIHLTEQEVHNSRFVAGTLFDVLVGAAKPPSDRPVIFSPFGLGMLDLTVARYVYDQVQAADGLLTVPGFFHELERYG